MPFENVDFQTSRICFLSQADQLDLPHPSPIYPIGFNADVLVQFLSSRDIYVSPCYSACSEDADYRVALALGMTKEEASQTIRVSFGAETTEQDIDVLVDAIVEFKELFM